MPWLPAPALGWADGLNRREYSCSSSNLQLDPSLLSLYILLDPQDLRSRSWVSPGDQPMHRRPCQGCPRRPSAGLTEWIPPPPWPQTRSSWRCCCYLREQGTGSVLAQHCLSSIAAMCITALLTCALRYGGPLPEDSFFQRWRFASIAVRAAIGFACITARDAGLRMCYGMVTPHLRTSSSSDDASPRPRSPRLHAHSPGFVRLRRR
jgi:hypothetical protein